VKGPRVAARPGPRAAYTLIELVTVMVIVGILASLGVPRLNDAFDKALVAKAITDVRAIASDLSIYFMNSGVMPDDLSGVDHDTTLDPWGAPYQYLDLTQGKQGGSGPKPRKDRFLVPINSDFDLYSKGADGETATALTVKISQDDVLRAADGKFIGLAIDF